MRQVEHSFDKLILVCVNEREDGRECCGQKGSLALYERLKTRVKEFYMNIRVSRTGCLGNCATGVTVAIMPDNLYFGEVREEDIETIVEYLKTGN